MNTVREIQPRTASSWSFVLSIILIVFGFFAIGIPALASLGFTRLLVWLVLFDGMFSYFMRSVLTASAVLWGRFWSRSCTLVSVFGC